MLSQEAQIAKDQILKIYPNAYCHADTTFNVKTEYMITSGIKWLGSWKLTESEAWMAALERLNYEVIKRLSE